MYNTLKNTLAIIALLLTFSTVSAATGSTATWSTSTWTTVSAEKFSMKEVKVVDSKTLNVSFNQDLLEDTSMFEFLLTNKKDDTKELALTWVSLTSSKDVTLKSVDALNANEDYNLVVVFASSKDGKIIENGVDGMVTFKTPSAFADATPVEAPMDAAPAMPEATPAVSPETTPVVTPEATPAQPTDVAAWEAKTLPQTWAKEVLILALAMMLGLGFMFIRKRA